MLSFFIYPRVNGRNKSDHIDALIQHRTRC